MQPAKEVKLYPIEDSVKKNQGEGFICLYRSIKKHNLWKRSRKKSWFEAWIDLLIMANFSENKEPVGYDLIQLKRGEILTSQEKLAKEWKWDRSSVRSFLALLEKDSMIALKVTNKFTVITICNYGIYNDRRPTKQHQVNSTSTALQHIQQVEQVNSSTPAKAWVYSHKGFFDRQLIANEGKPQLDKYQKLVEFLHEKDEEGNYRFGNILSLERQMSYRDYIQLKEVEQSSNRNLKEVLEAMEDRKTLSKDHKNVYLTAKAWLRREFKN
jgi:hypothetical protein